MAHDVDLQQEILQKTLQEVKQENGDESIDLASYASSKSLKPLWLQQCKTEVSTLTYDLETERGPQIYHVPPKPTKQEHSTSSVHIPRRNNANRRFPRRQWGPPRPSTDEADPLIRRRHIYRHQLFSLRVGSNRLSQYRELTPQMFNRNEELVSRARKWIRRELQVFEFLNPPSSSGDSQDGGARDDRRANNTEFLLEYIIAILRTVDVKGSAGQAEELLRDFIGRDNARLFLHELQAWLRSPYNSLQDWDRNVQYDESGVPKPGEGAVGEGTRRGSGDRHLPGRRAASDAGGATSRGESSRGRIQKSGRRQRGRPGHAHDYRASQAQRLEFARRRHDPD
ncbi:hypothetical protein FQN54_002574 [Arachnomyces sp. PD_36]|nr:hypothetical protein FQN54_002574 [Arachnomyces sp. PD_36]